MENGKKVNRKILTTSGMLLVKRTVLRPVDKKELEKLMNKENVKSVVPLDEVLGIHDLPFKMTRQMMCAVAFWAQNQCSFKAAEAAIRQMYGDGVVSETVRKVTEYVGGIVFEKDTIEANFMVENMEKMEFQWDKEGVLYVQMDSASVNTRCIDDEGSTWRENKLGMVFSSDDIRTTTNSKREKTNRILKKEYTSYIGSVNEFKKYVYAIAVRGGYGRYKTTVILGDGATGTRNMCAEIFPNAIQILDLFHLCENVYEYAIAAFKNDETKYKPWSESVIDKFKTGKKVEALEQIENLQKKHKIPKQTVNLPVYVNKNMDRIDYDQYVKKGYYIGSGAIESGNKVVFQKRMKLASMRWNKTTAQHLLSLRAKFESGLWKECVLDEIMTHQFQVARNL